MKRLVGPLGWPWFGRERAGNIGRFFVSWCMSCGFGREKEIVSFVSGCQAQECGCRPLTKLRDVWPSFASNSDPKKYEFDVGSFTRGAGGDTIDRASV